MKHTQGTPNPVDFYTDHVQPAVFDSLAAVFPELKPRRKGGGWVATDEETTHAVFGARADRVVCNKPGGFLVYGGESRTWTAYVLGRTSSPMGADFVEAVKKLAERAGVDASPLERKLTPEETAEARERVRRDNLLEAFVEVTHAALLSDAGLDARQYLLDRGFLSEEEDAADHYDFDDLPLGFYESREKVVEDMETAGWTREELDASDILADGRWEGRLLIPWRDHRGQVSTVAARDLTGTAEEGAKYLYLKGGKKPPAFGIDVASRSREATEGSGVVVVEGLLDVVLLQSRGVDYAVALGGDGKLLNAERWLRLRQYGRFQDFTLCLDSDEAGRAGTLKAMENLAKVDQVRKVYVVPPEALGTYKDPDELIREEGEDAFLDVVKRAQPWTQYLGASLLDGVTPETDDRRRVEAVEKVLDLASGLRGPRAALDSEDLLRLTSEATGYNYESLAAIATTDRERKNRERAEEDAKDAAREIQVALSAEGGANVYELAADMVHRFDAIQERPKDEPPPFSVDALVAELKNAPEGLLSGWPAVDELGVRFQPKELSVLGARTGHGKTSALVGLFHNWVLNEKPGGRYVFYSHEEPTELVFCRLVALLCAEDRTPWSFSEVRDYLRDPKSRGMGYGWPDPEELTKAVDTFREEQDRLVVVHRPAWSASRIAAHARDLADAGEVDGVFVDYLQRIPPEAKADRRDMEVSAIGRTLKSLAVDLSVPVVVGAQINREAIPPKYQETIQKALDNGVEEAVRKMRAARPDLHNLREGGSEQEADLVLGLMNYAADLRTEADSDHATNLYEVGVLKNRYGQVGRWAALAFEGASGLIRDRDPRKDAF